MPIEPGRTLLHYRIVDKLGEGGMGAVYRAEDTRLGREIAIKVMPAELAADAERRRRFEQEARAVAALKHPNIVTIHSVEEHPSTPSTSSGQAGQAGSVLFITMELIEGRPLSELIPKGGLDLARLFELAIPAAEALSSAHAKRITHRDLKPANMMLDADGRLKVLDFGLAKLLAPDDMDGADAETATQLADNAPRTEEGKILGTAAYMSPEQAEGKPVDARTDIFSLGVVLYEMATGRRPFQGDTSISTISSILRDTPPRVSELKPGLPRDLGRIIARCLEKDPGKRFQTARDIANELEGLKKEIDSGELHEVSSASATRAVPPTAAPRLWQRPAVLIAGVLVILLAALGLPRLLRDEAVAVDADSTSSLAVFAFENLKDPDDPERLGQILQELVISDLTGIDPLRVVSSQRLFDVRKQIGGGNTEVAVKAGAGKMLTGSLSRLGEKWIVAAQMVEVGTGEVVQSESIDGTDLYAMVDRLTRELQEGLRITFPSDPDPIRQTGNPSLDAYRVFLEGVDALNDSQFPQAEEKFRAAIELAPDWGEAHYKLAITLGWQHGFSVAARQKTKEILERRLYASDKQRRMAEAWLAYLEGRGDESHKLWQAFVRDYPDEKEGWYGLGESQVHSPPQDGKLLESIASFERALELDPDFLLAYTHIFEVEWYDRRYDDALARADRMIIRDPGNPSGYVYKAVTLALVGDEAEFDRVENEALAKLHTPAEREQFYGNVVTRIIHAPDNSLPEKVEEYLLKSIQADPEHDSPEIVRAWHHYAVRTGDEAAAAEALAAALKSATSEEGRTWVYSDAGESCGGAWELNRALELMQKAMELAPTQEWRTRISNQIGYLEHARGRPREAQRWFQAVLDVDPEDLTATNGMFWSSAGLGDRPAILRNLAALHQVHPWVRRTAVANNALWSGRIDEARREYELFEQRQPGELDHLIPHMLIFADQVAEAVPFCRRALESPTADKNPLTHLTLADSYLMLGRFDDAQRVLEQALDGEYVKPEETLPRLALCRLAQGDPDEAEALIRRGLEVGPVGWAHWFLALAHIEQGRYEAALAVAEQCVARDSTRFSHELLAWVLIAGDLDIDRGIREARQALELFDPHFTFQYGQLRPGIEKRVSPWWPPAEHSIGLAYLKKKDARSAVEYLQRAAEISPERESVQRDLERAKALLASLD